MWPGIRKELYVQRTIAEEDGMVSLEAPVRAEDAAVVPITMRVPANISADAKVVVGTMNRAGLAGAVWELDDRMTAYDTRGIVESGLDGGE